jgi:hypothetical protein
MVTSLLHQLAHIIILRCNIDQQPNFPSPVHAPMFQSTVLYALHQFPKSHKQLQCSVLSTCSHCTFWFWHGLRLAMYSDNKVGKQIKIYYFELWHHHQQWWKQSAILNHHASIADMMLRYTSMPKTLAVLNSATCCGAKMWANVSTLNLHQQNLFLGP